MNTDRLSILATEDEQAEVKVALGEMSRQKAISAQNRAMPKGVVKLRRTFSMCGFKFWRVVAPQGHANYESDLSLEGLKEWGIIP